MKKLTAGVKPKKFFGQHFLKNRDIAKNIAALGKRGGLRNILEIGPGMGMLTEYLLEPTIHLKTIEIDDESATYLKRNFPEIEVIQGDFLKADIQKFFDGSEFAVVGNFPYNISSQIVFKILENRNVIPYMAGMFQKEVAERIGAKPGSKDYGILSVLTQLFYTVEYHLTVEPGNFNPPPKVRSGVISLKRLETPLCSDSAYEQVKYFVKTAFNQRRKTLRNALKSLNIPAEMLKDSIFDRRAEQLSPFEFVELSKAVALAH
ncbi:ribosomal RNA small subunit methyltransferase A [Thermaurantimonas aggregans]|uniref:Ribosomal RNA small subunit methyltransferase A n=1 Tax=Thermaurantimonas aggregans TaxID=2173829 RepID=A0A401XMI3_9FLAO|nr:16S rRNA (adenine(1518)-N(6)/adenine(1519)-N(6))-dimethyltransferase RsmA [Thermaurantimonas aggregans]MCX8148426.1 16S rRNA (adenine(1518)-N(6)/adenine(1519)-N(6))-dimethyltransferase RsmA [Thermaurantimonas aggregans]GCD78230.1 ribosomal RNA small subunit methyltransferase A [Thermaurantimonas aggregans]